LTIFEGGKSWKHLRIWNGQVFATFKEACMARGLLEDDHEWRICLEEAIRFGSTLLQHTRDNAQGRILRQPIITQHHYSNFDHFHQSLPISAYIHYYPQPIFYYVRCRLDGNQTTAGRASNWVTKQIKRRV